MFIDGVLLQATPIDVNSISKTELRAKLTRKKRNHLDSLDAQAEVAEKDRLAAAAGKTPETGDKKSSYAQRLTVKILDNLEVTISNVHIRYEDSLSSPGSTFAAGITLGSFSISTTDWNWNKAFLSRDQVNAEAAHNIRAHSLFFTLGDY